MGVHVLDPWSLVIFTAVQRLQVVLVQRLEPHLSGGCWSFCLDGKVSALQHAGAKTCRDITKYWLSQRHNRIDSQLCALIFH